MDPTIGQLINTNSQHVHFIIYHLGRLMDDLGDGMGRGRVGVQELDGG